MVQNINDTYAQFEEKRQKFYDNLSDRKPVEFTGMRVEYRDHYSKWVFEQISRIVNGGSDKERLKDLAESSIFSETPTGHPEQGITAYPGAYHPYTTNSFLEVHAERDDLWDDSRDEIEQKLVSLLQEEIEGISETGEFRAGFEAARILAEIDTQIQELDRTLIEYEGKPIYGGDCEYLDEVTI